MPTGPAQVKAHGSTRDAVRNFFETEVRNGEKIRKHELGLTDDDELPPYVHQDYPKAMYPAHEGDDTIVVQNADEEAKRSHEGFFATLAEAKAHYARNGDGEFDDDDDGDDEDLPLAAGDSSASEAPKKPVKKRATRRRR